MAQFSVPDHLISQLKCSICYELLSYAPIHYHPETGSVCGRHPFFETERNSPPIHEKNYECIGGIISFPCRYLPNGCPEKCTMTQMPEHEDSCSFKPYYCPVLPLGDCAWQGSPKELHAHFAATHQILLLEKPEFELDIVNNYKEHYLIPMSDELFVLRVEFQNSDKIFRCCVYYIGKPSLAENYEYQIEFKSRDVDSFWSQTKLPVESDLNILQHKNECTIALENLKEILLEPSFITCEVQITKKEIVEELFIDSGDEDVGLLNIDTISGMGKLNIEEDDKFLDSIECQVCQEYMIPPIYQCLAGHNICEVCKPKLRDCPTCRGQIASTRNFALEKLTEMMKYPCKNIDEGCLHRTNSLLIRNHEKDCEFKPSECLFRSSQKCSWFGRAASLFQHCKGEHPTYVQKGQFFQLTYNPDCERFEIFKIKLEFGLLFKMIYSYTQENVSCAVLCTTRPKDNSKLMYEIEVVDLNDTGLKLLSKKMCGFLSDRVDDIKHCTVWDIDMVKPFMSQNDVKLKFRCVIHKI